MIFDSSHARLAWRITSAASRRPRREVLAERCRLAAYAEASFAPPQAAHMPLRCVSDAFGGYRQIASFSLTWAAIRRLSRWPRRNVTAMQDC